MALAILGLSLSGLLSLAMNAQLKVARAVEKWENTHKMIQAVEYVMLFDDENLKTLWPVLTQINIPINEEKPVFDDNKDIKPGDIKSGKYKRTNSRFSTSSACD